MNYVFLTRKRISKTSWMRRFMRKTVIAKSTKRVKYNLYLSGLKVWESDKSYFKSKEG